MGKLSERYNEVDKHGSAFQGKNELLKHLNGDNISARQAIKAKCYDCMGYFNDGKQDCKTETCSLYPFMAYREGGVRKSRVVSSEQREKARQRFAKIRNIANSNARVSQKLKLAQEKA